jgi:DNA-binding LytR/AlgR family response regulator
MRNEKYLTKLQQLEKEEGEHEITIYSANKAERLQKKLNAIITIKSADNYIDVFYFSDDLVKNRLIRNTLKSIEDQLINQVFIVRCHRTCLINSLHIDKLVRTPKGYQLKMRGIEKKVAVSKQYLPLIKQVVEV